MFIAVLKFLLVLSYIAACGVLVFVVLLQQGRGAGMGASLGGGASQTLFGSQASNFMTRLTGAMAAAYMILALVLARWPPFGNDTSSDVQDILTPVEIEEVEPPPAANEPAAVPAPASEQPAATPPDTAAPAAPDSALSESAEPPAAGEAPAPAAAPTVEETPAVEPAADAAAEETPPPAAPELTPAEAAAASAAEAPAAP